MVFQSFALFPHMSVSSNVSFGLRMRRIPKARRNALVDEALALVGLQEFRTRLPHELSGGQQQRVGVARAIVVQPDLLLLDEPLSNLDSQLRREMASDVRETQQRLGLTAVYVTHDHEEALAVSDRIAVMKEGSIHEIGKPRDMFTAPRSAYTARIIGHINVIPLESTERLSLFGATDIRLHSSDHDSHSYSYCVVPPDRIDIQVLTGSVEDLPHPADRVRVIGTIRQRDYRGATIRVGVRVRDDVMITGELDAEARASSVNIGDQVVASWAVRDMHLMQD